MIKKIDQLLDWTQESWDQKAWFEETTNFILGFIKESLAEKSIENFPVDNSKLINKVDDYLESVSLQESKLFNDFKAALIFFRTKEYTFAEEYLTRATKTINKLNNNEVFLGIKFFCLAKIQMEKGDFRKSNEFFLKGFKIINNHLNFNEKTEYLIHWSYLFIESNNPKLAETILNLLANKLLPQINHAYSLLLYILFLHKRLYNRESAMSYANLLLSCPDEYLDNDEWYILHLFCGDFFAKDNENLEKSIYHLTMANNFLSRKWKVVVKQISLLQDVLKLSEYLQIRKTYEDKMLEIILENNLHNNHYLKSLKNAYEELQKVYSTLQEYSFTDGLTKLYNRRYLWEKISDFFVLAMKEKVPVSCLLIDFDDFKKVNDTYGHIEGDKVLKRSCKAIKSLFKKHKMIIRFGGEEILILLLKVNKSQAIKTAEKLRKTLEELEITTDNGDTIKVTVSIGISLLNKIDIVKPNLLDKMIMEADRSMYLAKSKGKNRVEFITDFGFLNSDF
ncbi:MAG: GGDEF domain-containing protein [Candidatus Cloacimonetes bacterium]|nr:GGDEF domain-containing protein [Candidatus Cloacimonadota bacterium]